MTATSRIATALEGINAVLQSAWADSKKQPTRKTHKLHAWHRAGIGVSLVCDECGEFWFVPTESLSLRECRP